MKKIPTIFERNPEERKYVLDVINPECLWVFNGEGEATRKYDGTCCMVNNGQLFKRREIKKGKSAPDNFQQCDSDGVTGKRTGWVPVGDGAEDQYHREAFKPGLDNGTYELIGPKVQGNPEGEDHHILFPHNAAIAYDIPDRSYHVIKNFLRYFPHEGIVFHHPLGSMAKIKRKDFKWD